MQITLATSRTITLVHLTQWLTYYGLLAGIPYREGNQDTIDRALEKARAECMEGLKPCLIHPVATPVPYRTPGPIHLFKHGMNPEQYAEYWHGRHYETLPAVACIGHFDSGELKRPGSELFSTLTVVWFQDQFATPIDPGVLAQIERLDWEGLAKDWMW